MVKNKYIQSFMENLKMKRIKDKNFPPMIIIFMGSKEPEIKSKQEIGLKYSI